MMKRQNWQALCSAEGSLIPGRHPGRMRSRLRHMNSVKHWSKSNFIPGWVRWADQGVNARQRFSRILGKRSSNDIYPVAALFLRESNKPWNSVCLSHRECSPSTRPSWYAPGILPSEHNTRILLSEIPHFPAASLTVILISHHLVSGKVFSRDSGI